MCCCQAFVDVNCRGNTLKCSQCKQLTSRPRLLHVLEVMRGFAKRFDTNTSFLWLSASVCAEQPSNGTLGLVQAKNCHRWVRPSHWWPQPWTSRPVITQPPVVWHPVWVAVIQHTAETTQQRLEDFLFDKASTTTHRHTQKDLTERPLLLEPLEHCQGSTHSH